LYIFLNIYIQVIYFFTFLIIKYPGNSNHMLVTVILRIMLKAAKFKLSIKIIKTEKKTHFHSNSTKFGFSFTYFFF